MLKQKKMNFHLWKIFRIILFASAITAKKIDGISVTHSMTESGYIKYRFANGTSRFCEPILTPEFCKKGHEIQPCFKNREKDRCVPCSGGEYNLDETTSDFQTECYIFSCPEGTVYHKGKVDTSKCDLPCICDESTGWIFKDECSCKRASKCRPNYFLKDGQCLHCPVGSQTTDWGYGPCIPAHTDVRVTEVPSQVPVTLQSSTHSLSQKFLNASTGTVVNGENNLATDLPHVEVSTDKQEESSNDISLIISLPLLGLSVIFITIFIIMLLRRRLLNRTRGIQSDAILVTVRNTW